MAFTLYAATIPAYLQILGSMSGLIDKAEAHCRDQGLTADTLLGARLADDMHPFAYQVKSTVVHSLGAIEGVRKGSFSPDTSPLPTDFDTLRDRVAGAVKALQAIDPAEIDGFIGRDMCFEFGSFRMDFTAEDFLLSFSQPNFYFHATTAYAILRMKGVEVGKRDFMGQTRRKP
ncbi:DUF1993 domain-containing protein [Sphingobium nicotianae]|uniref:DUF1993 family protein n=1 Tax=Sphingobium nicotianae TaxID=2782607 RepID=A0A9X1DBC9_9SPHN|nr:DUF1993 domain-containing protein [Sphingobium nicotianae]MBT2186851.1 DUF1993 family protein [Sphingobium nicotianae]